MKSRCSRSYAGACDLGACSAGGRCSLVALGLLVAATSQAALPVSGRPAPGMAVFDTTMTDFMNDNSITAGVLGISRNGRIEYLRSFGWLTAPDGGSPGVPLPENTLMRTASIVKPVTAAAVRQFSDEGRLGLTGLDSPVFNGLVVGVTGMLDVTPMPVLADSRSADITINHLLLHEGGFDRSVDPPGNVMFKSRYVAEVLGINSPPSNVEVMGYMLAQQLQWDPGTVSNLDNENAYSNYGYMVLGEVLQTFAPGGYLGYVQSRIMSPDRWIPSTEFLPARSLLADRHPREPVYIASGNGPSVFDNSTVPNPYGSFCIESMLAHGGVIASAQAMIRFANAFHVWYENGLIGQPITAGNPMQGKAHSGWLDGCETWLEQRTDGVVVYFALNRSSGAPYAEVLAGQIADHLNAGDFTWPDSAADGFWVTLGEENPGAGFGGYHSTYQGFQSALDRVTDGSYLRLRSGHQAWTGPITKRVILDAPEGPVTLGQ